MALAEEARLAVRLDLGGNFMAKLSQAARALQGFDKHTSNTQRSLGKLTHNLERGLVIGATAAVGGFVAVAKAAGDFEAQMNTIATIVDRKDLGKIGQALRQTARDTGISLDDLTNAYYDLASAGVKGQLATDALNDAVKLGIGGLATTAQTVDLLTTAINAYSLDSKGAAIATDQFAQAVADGKVKASEIAETFANVASVAKAFKVGIDQIAASYAFLTAQGVPAAEVTTEMQRAIISLAKPLPLLEKAQQRLNIVFTDEIAKKGLVPALQELRLYSDRTKIPLIALLGRIEAVKYVLQTTGPNFKGYNAELAKMGHVSGVAAAQMAERQQGLNFQLARLKALAKDAGITLGTALLPKLTPLVSKLNDFITANQGKIAEFGQKLADGFTKFADAIGKVDWQPFIDGLRISSDIAKTAINLFMSLPNEVKAAAVGAFAVNKLTGGLPTSIIKDIGGAAISQFAGRGSSPANPLWVTSVGIGGGGGAAGGGLAGGILRNVVVPVAAVVATKEALNLIPDMGLAQSNFDRAVARAEAAGTTGLLGKSSLGPVPVGFPLDRGGREKGRADFGAGKVRDDRLNASQLALAAALDRNSRAIHGFRLHLNVKDIIKGITERSAAKFGHGGLGPRAVDATFQRNLLREASGIAGSNTRPIEQKLGMLVSIQAALKAHGDTKAAALIGRKIDAAKAAQVSALNAKKLAVTVSVGATTVNVNARGIAMVSAQINRYGGHVGVR